MAMGERAPVALLDAPASGRLAVGEAMTNIIAADIRELDRHPIVGELDGGMRRAGRGCRLATRRCARSAWSLCAKLGITIPVGKDSLSMRTAWTDAARSALGDCAGVARHLGVRAGVGRAPHAHPGTRFVAALAPAADRLGRAARIAWADPAGRRCSGCAAASRRISMILNCCATSLRPCASSKTVVYCSPITTAPTADCW